MKYYLLLIILVISSCSPKLTRYNYKEPAQRNNQNSEVNYVFKKIEFSGFDFLGKAEFDDNGFVVNCSFDEIMALFKNEACNLGANIVYVYDIKLPGVKSTCFRAKTEFYKGDYATVKLAEKEKKTDTTKTKEIVKPVNTIIEGHGLFGEFGIGALFFQACVIHWRKMDWNQNLII